MVSSWPSRRAPFKVNLIEWSRVSASSFNLLRRWSSDDLSLTAITLEQRGKNPRYSVFTGSGTLYVDSVTGEISEPPPPSPYKRWVGQAHFFNFAGKNRSTLLIGFALLSAMSTLSGLVLLLGFVWRQLR